MNIDWFTFVAQIINFLVLVGLLRWFLYGPIVRAMQQREERIADRLAQADQEFASAQAKAQHYDAMARKLEEQREQQQKELELEAQKERDRLMHETREEVNRRRDQWIRAFEHERDDLLREFRVEAAQVAVTAARTTLAQLADCSLEHQMMQRFIGQLHELDESSREEIRSHVSDGATVVRVRSVGEMPDDLRRQLLGAIRDAFGYQGDVSFEVSNELGAGIELDVGGFSFGWNVNQFLREMEGQFQRPPTATSGEQGDLT